MYEPRASLLQIAFTDASRPPRGTAAAARTGYAAAHLYSNVERIVLLDREAGQAIAIPA
jgi:hypothetical protein